MKRIYKNQREKDYITNQILLREYTKLLTDSKGE